VQTCSSNCHNFIVRRFILLPFKHQTNKPTAISAQHNQWKQKHKTAELQTTFTAGSDLCLVTVGYIYIKYDENILWSYRNIEGCSPKLTCSGNGVWTTSCVCVCVRVALVILHAAKRMRSNILSSLACPAVPYISTLSHKYHGCWKNIEHETYVLISSTTFVWHIFLMIRREHRNISITVHISVCMKSAGILSDFNKTFIFLTDFGQILKHQI